MRHIKCSARAASTARTRAMPSSLRVVMIMLVALVCVSGLMAQNPQVRPGTLRGQVTDPSGASIAGATVVLTTPAGQTVGRTTDANGTFEVPDLAPGNYNLAVTIAGFAPGEQGLQIVAGQVQQLTVPLDVAAQQQEVTVSEVAPTVDASPRTTRGGGYAGHRP